MLRSHETIYKDEKSLEGRTYCHFPNCDKSFYQKSLFITHLTEHHNVNVCVEHHQFSCEGDFFIWKEKEELKDFVYFSKQRGDHTGKLFKNVYYNCQHDGEVRTHRRKDQEERITLKKYKKGLVKTGAFCPARMIAKVALDNGQTEITYIKSHNHPVNISNTVFQPIPNSLRAAISSKLAVGVPVKDVYQDLRENLANRDQRGSSTEAITKAHLITKRNISDISRCLKYGRRLHPDDSTSTYLLVKKLEKENFNPIVVYKPQGEKTLIGPNTYDSIDLKNDLFVIGIQTKQQLEMMQKHASKIICIDSTHRTNQYHFPLVNLVVPDEFNKGYPVGHLISNHADELVLTPFFEEIKARCKDGFKINAVMTDDDNSGWNAFTNVFGESRHLLCKWHIKRAWRNKIPLVGNTDLQEEVYQTLELLIDEKSICSFTLLMSQFITKYSSICPTFMNYFKKYYASRAEKWAMCYRNFEHANTDTNMFVEAFHNKLKTFYMERRPNKRLDDLINLLLLIEEDDYWRHKRDMLYYNPEKVPSAFSNSRHTKGVNIIDIDVEQISSHQWEVMSQTKREITVTYKVDKILDRCTDNTCDTKCMELACIGLCEHIYTCNCDDPVLLCKHIHKIHSLAIRSNERKLKRKSPELQTSLFHQPSDDATVVDTREVDHFEKFLQIVERLSTLVKNPTVGKLQLPSINRKLVDMIKQAEAIAQIPAIESESLPSTDPEIKYKPMPNEKLDLQWQPKRFSKTKKEYKKGNITKHFYPSNEKKDVIKKRLNDKDVINDVTANENSVASVKKTDNHGNANLTSKIVDDIDLTDYTRILIR